ncbi:MAG TPA: TIGR03915 family putative DNA repair protein [bacterium]|nr:TIGR03915 family putative DNA repair protein [bacterium]
MNTLYLFDGTLETYISIIPVLWAISEPSDRLLSQSEYTPGIFEKTVYLDENSSDNLPVKNNAVPKEIMNSVIYAFSSGIIEAVEKTPQYLNYIKNNGVDAMSHLAQPSVSVIFKASRKTASEAHKLKGILRFRKLGNIFYGPYFSKCFVLPILAEHFKNRLPNELWILHDTERKTGVFYNGKTVNQAFFSSSELSELAAQYEKAGVEDQFETLWKKYFEKIANQHRLNQKLQQSFMPKQYWRFIPEVAKRVL